MKRILASLGALAVAILALTAGYARSSVATAAASDRDITQFQTMIGDHGAFRGTPGAIGGVPAAGLPWVIQAVQGELALDGELKIDVDGLVLADAPSVPASLRGTNPVPFFSAVVSCTTVVGGAITTGNVMTGNFDGDAGRQCTHRAAACVAASVHRTGRPGHRAGRCCLVRRQRHLSRCDEQIAVTAKAWL